MPSPFCLILKGDNRAHPRLKSFDAAQDILSAVGLATSESSQNEAAAQGQKRPALLPGKAREILRQKRYSPRKKIGGTSSTSP
jgi:hypothetical protein